MNHVLPVDPFERELYLAFGPDWETPSDESVIGKAKHLGRLCQSYYKVFEKEAAAIILSHPLPSPDQAPKLLKKKDNFEASMRQEIEIPLLESVIKPTERLAQEINVVPQFGTTDAAQAIKHEALLALLEKEPDGHNGRAKAVEEAIAMGDEGMFLAVVGAGPWRWEKLFRGLDRNGIPFVEHIVSKWNESKVDQDKKSLLTRTRAVIESTKRIIAKYHGLVLSRCDQSPTSEQAMRARLITDDGSLAIDRLNKKNDDETN